MIQYKPARYRELTGEFKARVVEVTVEDNKYFDPDKENSTPQTLTIKFLLEDPETLEERPFTERFISPLIYNKGLFAVLLDIMEELPDEDGGEFNEQKFVDLELIVDIQKSKKNEKYSNIASAKPLPAKSAPKPKAGKAKEEANEVKEEDLPF